MEESNKITIKPPNSVFSGHELIIIPKVSKFIPSVNQIEASLEILKNEYPDCEIESIVFDSVEFIDQGQNFDKVICNLCKTELSLDYWQDKMSESYDKSHFDDMNFQTACCKKTTNLNELIYEGDCGFSTYRIAVNNAEPNDEKENILREKLSNILGCDIKIFWKHI